jgi:hypothetical protein
MVTCTTHSNNSTMHPLVRDLYKRVLTVGRDYPTGLSHVKEKWKTAILDPKNCPSCYGYNGEIGGNKSSNNNNNNNNPQKIDPKNNNNDNTSVVTTGMANIQSKQCEEEILFAVHKGRCFVKEMIGVIQLKKYRTMKQRYGEQFNTSNVHDQEIQNSINNLDNNTHHQQQQQEQEQESQPRSGLK